jgi:(2Fe-2S) ferredoxin
VTREHPGTESHARPGMTACSLCSGETLDGRDPLAGGQRTRLERLAADGIAHLTFAECLDECERGDVVVVRPAPAARRAAAARPVWFERLAGDEATGELRRWLADGGPGVAPLPATLNGHVITKDDAGSATAGADPA